MMDTVRVGKPDFNVYHLVIDRDNVRQLHFLSDRKHFMRSSCRRLCKYFIFSDIFLISYFMFLKLHAMRQGFLFSF